MKSKERKSWYKRGALWTAFLSIFGLADALYLTISHYTGLSESGVCKVVGDCNLVLESSYAAIGGVPIALLGTFYYTALVILSLLYFSAEKRGTLFNISALSGLGFLFSLFLVYLQIFVIEAVCVYCMTSAGITILIFTISTVLLNRARHDPGE